ncbi:MAG: DUF6783 domain-containing protein [Ruminococcus sp.]
MFEKSINRENKAVCLIDRLPCFLCLCRLRAKSPSNCDVQLVESIFKRALERVLAVIS